MGKKVRGACTVKRREFGSITLQLSQHNPKGEGMWPFGGTPLFLESQNI